MRWERLGDTESQTAVYMCVCARARVRVYVCVCWKIIKTSYMLVRGPELQQCFNTKERKIMKSKSFHVLKAITWTCVNIPEFSRFIWLNTLHSVSLFPQDIGYCCLRKSAVLSKAFRVKVQIPEDRKSNWSLNREQTLESSGESQIPAQRSRKFVFSSRVSDISHFRRSKMAVYHHH